MTDLYTDELAAALRLPGCPLCRTAPADERRFMDSWWREGRNSKDGRQRFYDGGGFCRRHAWLLHEVCVAHGSGAAVAAVYGALADRDLARLDREPRLAARARRRPPPLAREAPCSACAAAEAQLGRRAYFLLQLLAADGAWARYAASDGLCLEHLVRVVEAAEGEGSPVAELLLGDWRRRLAAVRAGLAELERRRDHRYADEPKGSEQESWTAVVELYVGPRAP